LGWINFPNGEPFFTDDFADPGILEFGQEVRGTGDPVIVELIKPVTSLHGDSPSGQFQGQTSLGVALIVAALVAWKIAALSFCIPWQCRIGLMRRSSPTSMERPQQQKYRKGEDPA